MATVKEFYNSLKEIDVDSLTETIIEENKSEIINLNADRLTEGKNIDEIVVGTYSYFTQELARESNPLKPKIAGQPYNFVWTGNLFDGMFIQILNGMLEVNSTGTGDEDKRLFVKENRLLGFTESEENFVNWKLLPSKFRDKINAILRKL